MKIVYSGSFNPWHEGHTKVALDIKRRFGFAPILEINCSASQCTGKSGVTGDELVKRLKILPDYRVIVTPYDLFVDKANYIRSLLNIKKEKKIWFACGSDTIERMDCWLGSGSQTGYISQHNIEVFLASNIGMITYPRFKKETIEIDSTDLQRRTIIVSNFEPLEISSTEIRNANKVKTVA